MEQCKLIKDKKCLLLNRLRGDLIVSDFVSEIPLVSGKNAVQLPRRLRAAAEHTTGDTHKHTLITNRISQEETVNAAENKSAE